MATRFRMIYLDRINNKQHAVTLASFLTLEGCYADDVQAVLQEEGVSAFLVTLGGNLIAAMIIRSGPTESPDSLHICALCVSRQFRNQGFATRMIRRLRDLHPRSDITLNVMSHTPHLIGFYTRRGFTCMEATETFVSMTSASVTATFETCCDFFRSEKTL